MSQIIEIDFEIKSTEELVFLLEAVAMLDNNCLAALDTEEVRNNSDLTALLNKKQAFAQNLAMSIIETLETSALSEIAIQQAQQSANQFTN
jgi:hypothetical protein